MRREWYAVFQLAVAALLGHLCTGILQLIKGSRGPLIATLPAGAQPRSHCTHGPPETVEVQPCWFVNFCGDLLIEGERIEPLRLHLQDLCLWLSIERSVAAQPSDIARAGSRRCRRVSRRP